MQLQQVTLACNDNPSPESASPHPSTPLSSPHFFPPLVQAQTGSSQAAGLQR